MTCFFRFMQHSWSSLVRGRIIQNPGRGKVGEFPNESGWEVMGKCLLPSQSLRENLGCYGTRSMTRTVGSTGLTYRGTIRLKRRTITTHSVGHAGPWPLWPSLGFPCLRGAHCLPLATTALALSYHLVASYPELWRLPHTQPQSKPR